MGTSKPDVSIRLGGECPKRPLAADHPGSSSEHSRPDANADEPQASARSRTCFASAWAETHCIANRLCRRAFVAAARTNVSSPKLAAVRFTMSLTRIRDDSGGLQIHLARSTQT
jgi:hypothetical protein